MKYNFRTHTATKSYDYTCSDTHIQSMEKRKSTEKWALASRRRDDEAKFVKSSLSHLVIIVINFPLSLLCVILIYVINWIFSEALSPDFSYKFPLQLKQLKAYTLCNCMMQNDESF